MDEEINQCEEIIVESDGEGGRYEYHCLLKIGHDGEHQIDTDKTGE